MTWKEVAEQAAQRRFLWVWPWPHFTETEKKRSNDWMACAVGEQALQGRTFARKYPKTLEKDFPGLRPVDTVLCALGVAFNHAVHRDDPVGVLTILPAIENRALELDLQKAETGPAVVDPREEQVPQVPRIPR